MIFAIITVMFINGEPAKSYIVENDNCFENHQRIADIIRSDIPGASEVRVECRFDDEL